MSLNIIWNVIHKDFSIMKYYLENILETFITSFFNSFDKESINKMIKIKDLNKETIFDNYFEIISKLLNWIKSEYHPKVIYSDIISTLVIFKSYKCKFNINSLLLERMLNIINFSLNIEDVFKLLNELFSDLFSFSDKDLFQRFFIVVSPNC